VLEPQHIVSLVVIGMRAQRKTEHLVAHDLQDQQRIAIAPKMMMP
jgi:hypothetical protein